MSRFSRPVAAAAFAASAAVSGAAAGIDVDVDTRGCRVVRILADGRQVVEQAGVAARGVPGSGSISVSTSSRGSGASRSSVSASSSSDGSGRTVASATSTTDGVGRTVTRTADEQGCTVVIDERTAPGGTS